MLHVIALRLNTQTDNLIMPSIHPSIHLSLDLQLRENNVKHAFVWQWNIGDKSFIMALTKTLAVTQSQCPDNNSEFINFQIIAPGLDVSNLSL